MQNIVTIIITTRIRRMREGNIFSLCTLAGGGGGTPILPMGGRGYPIPSSWWGRRSHPRSGQGDTPSQVWTGDTPSQVLMGEGGPIPRSGWGYPIPGLDGGTPFQVWTGGTPFWGQEGVPDPRSGWGVPHSQVKMGVPHPRSKQGVPKGTLPAQDWMGYPPHIQGTEQHSKHLLHGGRYAFYVHPGGLSCWEVIIGGSYNLLGHFLKMIQAEMEINMHHLSCINSANEHSAKDQT